MLKSYFSKHVIEAGVDEAGRGCLAGPVVASAVILPKDYSHKLLTDSKLLNRKQREILRKEIINEALTYGIARASHTEIDQVNILNASFLAMHRAVEKLNIEPELLLIDGNRFNPYYSIAHKCIIKGDSKYLSIAAGSILAKTFRDDLMDSLAKKFPQYGWENNAGYSTASHREAIRLYGSTPHHRKSFRLLPESEQVIV